MICIFDIETIPHVKLLKKIYNYSGSDIAISQQAIIEQEQKTNSSFLPHAFHQIIAISAVIADDFGLFTKVNSIKGKNEKELIEAFLNFLDSHEPKLVSFNGRGFDMPLLMLRALQYNLTCKAYFEIDNREKNKNKWENYRSRYSDRFHVDLLDALGDFGAVRGLKLDHVCSMSGLPGKYDVSGDQVMELYYEGKIKKIEEYCESDVLNTYWLYLKHELLKGNVTQEDYARSIEKMAQNLNEDKSYAPIFKEFVHEELQRMQL